MSVKRDAGTTASDNVGGFLYPGYLFARCSDCHKMVSIRASGRLFKHQGVRESREYGRCRGSAKQVRGPYQPGAKR